MAVLPQSLCRLLRAITLLGIAACLGCATSHIERPPDAMEMVFASPEDYVRRVLLQVLTDDGYPLHRGAESERVITTGYREEMDGPWDRLLVYRVGVGRSRVDATVTPESETSTRVEIRVTYEAKRHLWSSWQDSTPPLQRNATTQLERIKHGLGLL